MKSVLYPTLEEALFLHTTLITRFGGAEGVLDLGLLESALARPRSGYYKSLSEQAGALLHSVAMNHCFVDGNKRLALALTAVFLRINDYRLRSSPKETERFILAVAAGNIRNVSDIASWLEKRMAAP